MNTPLIYTTMVSTADFIIPGDGDGQIPTSTDGTIHFSLIPFGDQVILVPDFILTGDRDLATDLATHTGVTDSDLDLDLEECMVSATGVGVGILRFTGIITVLTPEITPITQAEEIRIAIIPPRHVETLL